MHTSLKDGIEFRDAREDLPLKLTGRRGIWEILIEEQVLVVGKDSSTVKVYAWSVTRRGDVSKYTDPTVPIASGSHPTLEIAQAAVGAVVEAYSMISKPIGEISGPSSVIQTSANAHL
jgi:hypothetical protein